jgi:hypothetical protein
MYCMSDPIYFIQIYMQVLFISLREYKSDPIYFTQRIYVSITSHISEVFVKLYFVTPRKEHK